MIDTRTPEPAVGQRWTDGDERMQPARELLIVKMVGGGADRKAQCRVLKDGKATNRFTEIALSRFKPNATGYRFVGAA